MVSKSEIKDKILFAGCMSGAVLFFIFGWFSMRRTVSLVECSLAIASLIVSVAMWMIGNFLTKKNAREDLMRQFFLVNALVTILTFLFLIRSAGIFASEDKLHFLVPLVMIVLAEGALSCMEAAYCPKIDFKRVICEHKYLIGLLVFVGGLAAWQSGELPRWDEWYLYNFLSERPAEGVYDYGQLIFCGHLDLAYVALNLMLGTIVGNFSVGMSVGQMILYLVSVIYVYRIIGLFFASKSDAEKTILTAIYGVSPFLLSLVGQNYWDFWCSVLVVLVIYTALTKQWLLHLLVAGVFCFTKEPEFLFYGAFCATILLEDILDRKGTSQDRIKQVCLEIKYWGMLLIGAIWLFLYFGMTHWQGSGGFRWEAAYVVRKLDVFFVLNFNWLLFLVAVLGFIVCLAKKRNSEAYLRLLPAIIGDVALTAMNCAFVTVNHARYIDSHITVLILLAIIGICQLQQLAVRIAISAVTVALLFASNYFTFDPVTLHVFTNVWVGENTVMIETGDAVFSDSYVYNRQYRYFDRALDLAIEDAVYDKNGLVLVPVCAEWDNGWFFEGSGTAIGADNIQYWDEEEGRRFRKEKENTVSFALSILDEDVDVEELLDGRTGYYCYTDFAGADFAEQLREHFTVVEESVYSYRGFEVKRVKFSANGFE